MDLEETLLPGVGVRYRLRTRSGEVLAIVLGREGGAEVAVYDRRDPDRVRGVLRLEPDEVDAVAEVLGAPRLTVRMWVDGVTPAGLTLRLTDASLSCWRSVDLTGVAPSAARHRARRP